MERPLRKKHDGNTTRQQILSVALEQFTLNGYEGTPLRAVSNELGMTKAALYYHFDSKEALLRELIMPALQEIDRVIAAAEEAPPKPGKREGFITSYTDALIEHLPRIRLLARDMNVAMQPGIDEMVDDHMGRLQKLLMTDKADLEERTRVFAALTVLQRTLIGHRGEPLDPADPSETTMRRLAICMAMELLQGRCESTAT